MLFAPQFRSSILAVVASFALLALCGNAHGQQILDQEQLVYNGGMSARTLPGYTVWQSFTAGITGILSEIDMAFFNSMHGDGTLCIYGGEGNGGTLYQTVTVPVVADDGPLTWDSWSVNVPVISGQQYTFDLTPNPLTLPDPYGVCVEVPGWTNYVPYSGGDMGGNYSPSGQPWEAVFRTYVTAAPAVNTWASAVSGSWSKSSNWTGSVPNGIGASATFNAPTSAAVTVTLDTPVTLGTLQFGNSASANVGYTLSGSGSNTLTLTNSGNGAAITVTDGSHAINAPVILADNLTVTSGGTNPWTLSFAAASSITDNGAGCSLTMNGAGGTLILRGANSYTGSTTINAGVLQAVDGIGLPAASNLVFNGSLAQTSYGAVFQSSGTFSRSVGSGPGQVQWTGDGGFAANGGPLTVSMSPGAPLVWSSVNNGNGTPGFLGDLNALTFGSPTANNQVNFTDSIDLNGPNQNGGNRQIDVASGAGGDRALISGNIIDSVGGGGLTKTGAGLLILTGNNSYYGSTVIAGGALQAVDGVGLPSSANLVFSGSLAQTGYGAAFQSSGTFSRSLGNGPGQVQWTGDGGFAANGGPLTVSMSPGVPLVWNNNTLGTGTQGFVPDGSALTFGSPTANSQVNFTDSIDLNGEVRQIDVAAGAGGDSAVISGDIIDSAGGGGLTKTGAGLLILSGSDSYTGGTIVEAGTLEIRTAAALPAGTSLTVGSGGKFIFDPMATAALAASAGPAVSAVPEPSTVALLGVGAIRLLGYVRRRRKQSKQLAIGTVENNGCMKTK